jgi:CubicO group peptidase (beta-lactamase class C family)
MSCMRAVFTITMLLVASVLAVNAVAQPLNPALREQIDAFVEGERAASGIPGVALAIVNPDGSIHARGFGTDGAGAPISADTPFPVGSLTKSFTALLVRQAVDAGLLDVHAPVTRYLPWMKLTAGNGFSRITLQHLLNQTSGLSRDAGIAPLLQHSSDSIEDVARAVAPAAIVRPPGEAYEYSNLNFVLLGAVMEATTGKPWESLVHERILGPLEMTHSDTSHAAARTAGMTRLHRMWFGLPVAHEPWLAPGLAPTGSLVASAADMATYLRMLLNGGMATGARIVSAESAAHLLTPGSPPGRARLLSANFEFRYGEGWFVGPFGVASDARWHLGYLTSFAAWMVLLPESRQAVVLLINANTELPFGDAHEVMSRLPIGVVNLLRGVPAPTGPSLRKAYRGFNAAAAGALVAAGVAAAGATRSRRNLWAALLASLAACLLGALFFLDLSPKLLAAMAPDVALALAALGGLLCLPLAFRSVTRLRAGPRVKA